MRSLITFLFATTLIACNSTRIHQDANHPRLTEENLSNLNGVYDRGVWEQLRPTRVRAEDGNLVRLTVINKHKIKTELIKNDKVVSAATLRGKLRKNGYYSINPCINLIPTPFLFVFSRHKQDIIVTEKSDLHVAYSKYGLSVIFLMASGREDRGAVIYERRQ